MKKIIFILAPLLLLFSCEKHSNVQVEFVVLEHNTMTPIPGTAIEVYKCNQKDYMGDCVTISGLLGTTTTNKEGVAAFSASIYEIGAFKGRKERYWDGQNVNPFSSTTVYLTPIATLKVHLIRENTYPAGTILNVVSQPEGCNDCIWETRQLLTPTEATIYLKGGGYYNNSVGWYMNPGGPSISHSTPSVYINRFDTAEFEIRY